MKPEYKKLNSLHCLRLIGNQNERAAQHGAFLKEIVQKGAIPKLAKKNEFLIRSSSGAMENKWLQNSIVLIYKKLLLNYLKKKVPKNYLNSYKKFSEAAQLPFEIYEEALFQPDGLMLLIRSSSMKYLLGDIQYENTLGCSSVIIPPHLSECGRLLSARNLDYPITDFWEKNTTLLFHEPTEKNLIPHCSITSAGVHTSGVTAINKEGLTLSLHAHFSSGFNLNGLPITIIGEEILTRSKSISQAIDIAKKFTPTTNWSIIVTSAKEQSGAIIEYTPQKMEVRTNDNKILTHTNFYQSEALRKTEAILCGAQIDDFENRLCALNESISKLEKKVEIKDLCEILGSQLDPSSNSERVVGNVLGVITTVKSVVFDSENLSFWVSESDSAPAGQGPYTEIKIEKFWENFENQTPKQLPGYKPIHSNLREATEFYRRAFQNWHLEFTNSNSKTEAYENVQKAIALFPEDGSLMLMGGLIAFKLNDFEKSLSFFKKSKNLNSSKHQKQVCDLMVARIHDINGNREQSLSIYQKFDLVIEPKLRSSYLKGLRHPYQISNIAKMTLNLQFPDAIHY